MRKSADHAGNWDTGAWWGSCLLGLAMAGFLDGILFHQVLQWHHLLSNVGAPGLADLRTQVFADGLFHVGMYGIAALGLWLLWARAGAAPSGRAVLAPFLLGIGGWHVADAVLFHWILAIHHVRMDATNVIGWDIALFAVGLVCVLIGWKVGASVDGNGGASHTGPRVLPMLLTVSVSVAGPLAALPGPAAANLQVIFEPGTDPAQIMAHIQRLQGTMRDRAGNLWLIELPDPRRAESLYGAGALIISRAALRFGCFSQPASLFVAPDEPPMISTAH